MPSTKRHALHRGTRISLARSGAVACSIAIILGCGIVLHAQDDAPRPAVVKPKPIASKSTTDPTPAKANAGKAASSATTNTSTDSKAEAAKPSLPPPLPNVIVLDAAHGGADSGARIGNAPEKDVNQQIATRLRSLLQARSFDVKYLRDGDTSPSPDQRAGQANQARATACVIIHSAATGDGIRVYTSALHDQQSPADGPMLLRWNRAQAPYADQSRRLAERITTAFTRSKLGAATGRTYTVPIDSMQCAAVLIEVGPTGQGKTMPTDTIYQQQVAEAVAGTLMQWRDEAKAVVQQ